MWAGLHRVKGSGVRIVFNRQGVPDPAHDVQLIRRATGSDGKGRHFYLCLGCRDLIEVEDGKKHIHECEGKPAAERDGDP